MVATGSDDYSEGYNDNSGDTEQQKAIRRDLCIVPVKGSRDNYTLRAKMIRKYITWLLDDQEDEATKQAVGYLTRKYKTNLLMVVEQALPHFVTEHAESHPEFPMLRDSIDILRKHVATLAE